MVAGDAVGLEEREDVRAEVDGLVALGDLDGDGAALSLLGFNPEAECGGDDRGDQHAAHHAHP
jgi:hypothetical protein